MSDRAEQSELAAARPVRAVRERAIDRETAARPRVSDAYDEARRQTVSPAEDKRLSSAAAADVPHRL